MAENSKIEWTRHTWNPWRGCTKVSAGCARCYAETLSGRNPKTLGVWGPNGTRVVAAEAAWREPLKWDRVAAAAGERHRVFCASLADVFEDWNGAMTDSQGRRLAHADAWRGAAGLGGGFIPTDLKVGQDLVTMDHVRWRLFRLIHETPHLDWLLLTKRPENAGPTLARYAERIDSYVAEAFSKVWGRRVWLGTSVEDQKAADERIPHLLRTPAAVRFLSCEPLLGPLDLHKWVPGDVPGNFDAKDGWVVSSYEPNEYELVMCREHFDWVIAGGESGNGARPCRVQWLRDIVSQCKAAGVPVFVKQLGSNPEGDPAPDKVPDPETGMTPLDCRHVLTIRDRKGGDWSEWPDELKVREFPKPAGVPA